jgi:heat shock protein HslJ
MSRKLIVILLLASPLMFVSCDDNPLGPSELEGEWRLRSVTRSDGTTLTVPNEGPTRYSVRFEADGDIALKVDCNGCGGTYRIGGDSLTAGPFACTLILCAGDQAPGDFVNVLDGRSSLDLEGNRLTVSSNRGKAVFERQPVP